MINIKYFKEVIVKTIDEITVKEIDILETLGYSFKMEKENNIIMFSKVKEIYTKV